MPVYWKESIIFPIYMKSDKHVLVIIGGISLLPITYEILSNIMLSRLTPYAEEIIGDHQYGLNAKGQLLTIYSAFVKYLRKNGNTTEQCISYL